MLDSDNLIATQGAGTSFGEMTLFPKEGFGVYVARASTDLVVCYVGSDVLLPLMEKYPNIYAHLKARALSWDKRLRRQDHQEPQPLSHISNCQTLSKRTSHSNVLPFTRAYSQNDGIILSIGSGRN